MATRPKFAPRVGLSTKALFSVLLIMVACGDASQLTPEDEKKAGDGGELPTSETLETETPTPTPTEGPTPKPFSLDDVKAPSAWQFRFGSSEGLGFGPSKVDADQSYCVSFKLTLPESFRADESLRCRVAPRTEPASTLPFASCGYVSNCSSAAGFYDFQVKRFSRDEAQPGASAEAMAPLTLASFEKASPAPGGTTSNPGVSTVGETSAPSVVRGTFVIIQKVGKNGQLSLKTLTYPNVVVSDSLRHLGATAQEVKQTGSTYTWDRTVTNRNCTQDGVSCSVGCFQTVAVGVGNIIMGIRTIDARFWGADTCSLHSSIVR